MDDRSTTPHPPYEDFRRAAGEHAQTHAALDDFERSLGASDVRRGDVEGHVERLRAVPELRAHLELWWESPRTQQWLKFLSDAGL